MCCFSGPVQSVADTNIFARLSGRGTQFLVYSMNYAARRPVAMILPLPVSTPRREDAVRFISLKGYSAFFTHVERGFPQPRAANGGAGGVGGFGTKSEPLAVHAVGDFVASFVPTLDDFARLDRRFVLSRQVWDGIPAYRDYGFAVFQLRASTRSTKVHPMAFEFPTRLDDTLFFPTVHIHDGQMHPKVGFDHALYAQAIPDDRIGRATFWPSAQNAARFVDIPRAQGILVGEEKVYKKNLIGELPNQDTLVRV